MVVPQERHRVGKKSSTRNPQRFCGVSSVEQKPRVVVVVIVVVVVALSLFVVVVSVAVQGAPIKSIHL